MKLFANPHKPKQGIGNKIRRQLYKFIISKYCNGSKNVLDVGCGNNMIFIQVANDMGMKAKGLDMDERFKSHDVKIGDFFNFKGKCDVVFSNHVIERFTSDKQDEFIKKCTEISNDLVITISSYNGVKFYNTPDFNTPVTKVRMRWLFRRYGFRNILSVHIPVWQAVLTISKKVKDDEFDEEAIKIREGFW